MKLDRSDLSNADYVVRCRSLNPKLSVEIAGWIRTNRLLAEMRSDESTTWVDTEQLQTIPFKRLCPTDLAQYVD